MSILEFEPSKLLRNPHMQTILPNLLTMNPGPNLELTAFDIDLVQQFVLACRPASETNNKPILLVVPGIEGSHDSAVIKLLLADEELADHTFYVISHRGINTPNRQITPYHAALTDDLETVIPILRNKHPGQPIHAIGYSMGGNLLLNYLSKHHNSIDQATAISTPFDIAHSVENTPLLYQKQILKRFQQRALSGIATVTHLDWANMNTIKDFDRWVTAPYFGFDSADDYYKKASCKQVISDITCPTLIVNAADDPFVSSACWPDRASLPSNIEFIGTAHGGHMGFIYYEKGFHNWVAEIVQHQCQKYKGRDATCINAKVRT